MSTLRATLARRGAAEALGTAFLLAIVIGSGIMGERLAAGNDALALLANTLATGCGLFVLILAFGPVSGAHFNPVVSGVLAWRGELSARELGAYVTAQIVGALIGVMAAHLMFGEPLVSASTHARSGLAQGFSEAIATFGLIGTILAVRRQGLGLTAGAVGAYIAAAYWFTASTSFANPAVTLARSLSDSFAGIRPQDVPGFIAGQFVGAAVAALVYGWLLPTAEDRDP